MVATLTPTREAVELAQLRREFKPQISSRSRGPAKKCLLRLGLLAIASAAIYGAFFCFYGSLECAVCSASVGGAGAVIGLALTFSLVHGTFAGSLLEVLGIRELK